jgi:alanine racemase
MRIAIIPIGRADGLRSLTCGEVLVRGRRCPIVGRFSLEHTRVDVTDVDAAVGDEVVIIGEQDGERITLAEVSSAVGLDEVGMAVAVGPAIPREYVGAPVAAG